MPVDKPMETNPEGASKGREDEGNQPVGGGSREGNRGAGPGGRQSPEKNTLGCVQYLDRQGNSWSRIAKLSENHFVFPHLAQKSIEGFIAQPAFIPKDNIIPVTLKKIISKIICPGIILSLLC